ncbi:(2Fe-2S)-binding protein [Streptomyces sp. NA02950]|uniref:(2Fe-2S)-binding protein n=1 Tax=Streptomyces sp. NA02950 TaxID=2742137 RepID=UPI00158FFF61|nr:(2Fe-2S)-binding protein [Streptomyces sp. NA02950]QKV91979.1 (2Fe-2S)-binding protein [Streptomyces sp. NA02950]
MSVPPLRPFHTEPVRTGPAPTDALLGAYRRLAEALPSCAVTVTTGTVPPTGAGWVHAADLAAGGPALDAYLAWDEAQVARDYGQRARPDVIAGFGLHRYAWHICLLFTVPWFLRRRVPRLTVGQVSYHRTRGRIAVRTGEFACLPDDPAAVLPGARPVADEEALRAGLRTAAAEHLGPVLDAFRPRMRRGIRALWRMAADEITEGLWHVGGLLGEEPRAVAELTALLPGPGDPYPAGAAFRATAGAEGGPTVTRSRASCCLFSTLRPEEPCATCPRTADAERIASRAAN